MQDKHATYFGKRESGISLIGDLPWGSHFCQFYQTQGDLLEIFVPYLQAGLENNEFCVWVADGPRGVEQAHRAMKKAVPHFEQYARKGQTEIISRDQWHAGDGEPGSGVVAKLDKAVSKGFDGLRLAYDVLPEERHGRDAHDTADAVCRYNVIAVFAYPREKFDAIGLMEVMKNHRLALVKNAGRWEVIESSEARTVKDALRRSEEKLRSVFANMSEGFAYHRIVLDAQGNPCDYVFLEVNDAFERLTGLRGEDIVGKRVTEVLPGIEKDSTDWIGQYGKVALGGAPVRFESYSPPLRKWYSISAFSPHKGFFAVTFGDITERKAAEEAMQEANKRLQSQTEELQAQAEELQTQTEELNAQAEELRAANEELCNSEQALRENEQRLSRAQEIAHLGSWELDLVNGVLTWSDEVYRIFGLQPRQFGATYEAFLEAVHPDDRADVDAAYSSSVRDGRLSYEIEHRIVRRITGEIRWVHEKCQHVTDATGKVVRSGGMVLDVTERRKAEDALRRSEERFKLLSETAGRLLTAENPQEVVNSLCCKVMEHLDCQAFFNFLVDEQAGRLHLNACAGIPDEEARRIEWLDYGVAVCGCAARDRVRIVAEDIPAHPDPRTDMVRAFGIRAYACHPLLAEGKVLGTLSFGTRTRTHFSEDDLSLMKTVADQVAVAIERILAQRALRESEAQLQAVVENLNEGVVVADLEGRRLHWNRAALEMHGFASLEECRRRLPELADVFELSTTDGAILPVEQWPLARILRGEVLSDWEVRVRRLDNDRRRVFNYGGTLIRDAQGQPFMAVVTVGDITERKEAEEAVWSVALFPEQNPSPVLRIAREGVLLYANGMSAGLLESWSCCLGGTVPDEIRRHVGRALDIHEVMEVEVPCGQIVYSFAIAPVASEGYANLYGRDVTERKRAEAEREHHLDLHVNLVRVTQDVLDAADLPAVLQKVADASLELTGARLGVSGHGFVDGRPQVRAVSCGADAPPCQMAGGFALVKGGVHLDLLQERESIRLTDEEMRAHPSWWGLPQGHMPLRGLLGARLIDADGRPNGMIMVSDKAGGGDFTQEDEVILRQLASITSLAIRLIEARDEAQQRAREAIEAGAELRDGAERLALALEGGRMGRWEWDLQADSSFWDQRMYELLGVDASEPAESRLLLALVDIHDRNALQELLQGAATSGGDFQAEFRVSRPGGESVWLALCGRVIQDDQGRGARMFGVLYDVTQRKQMENELRRLNDELEEEVQAQTEELRDTVDRLQEEMVRRVGVEGKLRTRSQMLEGFFQHTITPLAFLDDKFNFIRVNGAYAAADGKSPEQFKGRNHFALYPDDENRAIFEQVVQTRQPYRAYAKPFHYSDAAHRGVTYWNWLLTPLLGEQGEVQFLVLNLEDVTERQRAFSELEQRARQLQKLTLELSQAEDRERRRLAEILHDDLQQQLAAAKFHLGILGGRVKENESARNMVGQLDQILRDAIDKSRSLSHELSPAVLYQSDLGETLDWLARQLQTKHGLTVYVDVAEPVHMESEAMKTFLFKAAQEILFNVVKHARVKEARLRLRRARGILRLIIADQGQGFDPQTLGKAGGFGLLSIRERIELLGGRMKVWSAKGQGSVFAIALPDAQVTEDGRQKTDDGKQKAEDGLLSSVLRHPTSGRRLRVVLADDHKVMREGLAALLSEQPDMDVVGQAGNGREAVNLTYSLHPDVVIMDIAMPVMAGDEATRQIKLHVPQTRVIALSMFEEAGVAEAVRRAGAETYLLKTSPFEELLAAVRGQTAS